MKKLLTAGSVLLLVLSLTACGDSSSNSSSSSSSSKSSVSSSHKAKKAEKAKENSSSSSNQSSSSVSSSSSSEASKSESSGKSINDFEQAFNIKLGNDNAAEGVTVNGTKNHAKITVQGPNSWNGISVQTDKWFNIKEKVYNDFDSLAKQYGVNDDNADFTWLSGDGNLIVKE